MSVGASQPYGTGSATQLCQALLLGVAKHVGCKNVYNLLGDHRGDNAPSAFIIILELQSFDSDFISDFLFESLETSPNPIAFHLAGFILPCEF